VTRAALGIATAVLATVLMAGCAAVPASSPRSTPVAEGTPTPVATNVVVVPQDAAAFSQLEKVAPIGLKLEGGTVTSTACWTPSEHLLNDPSSATAGTWKVLCRVYYDLKSSKRFQDTTCIGDFDAEPMLTHCYVWEYYSYVPGFADGDRLASPAPTPLP
jgi:hypothetical protein